MTRLSTLTRAHGRRPLAWALVLALLGGVSVAVRAQGAAAAVPPEAQRLYLRSLASTCAHCHGTDGQAVAGEALVRLAGLPRDHLLTQLMAFRTGDRKATVMHQITRGYSEQQLESLAAYFAAQK